MKAPSPALRHWLIAAAMIFVLFLGMPIFTSLV